MYGYRLYRECSCVSISETPCCDRVAPDREYEPSFSRTSFLAIDRTDDGEFSEAFEFEKY